MSVVKILRHPPLLFWLLTVLLLSALLLGAMSLGKHSSGPAHLSPALSAHDVAAVSALNGDVAALESAVGYKGAVGPLASSMAASAKQAASMRVAGSGADPLARDFSAVSAAASKLAAGSSTAGTAQVALLAGLSQSVDQMMADYQQLLARN